MAAVSFASAKITIAGTRLQTSVKREQPKRISIVTKAGQYDDELLETAVSPKLVASAEYESRPNLLNTN